MGSRVNFGGRLIGMDGAATYGAFLVGDTTTAFDGPGLLDPKHAEIHLVVRGIEPHLAYPYSHALRRRNSSKEINSCLLTLT
jgi:hypothetical protein